MFVQVIQGQVSDVGAVREAFDRWDREVAPGAVGFLGSTGGVTAEGRFITLARFESEEAARRNSDRPEQDRWWRETEPLFREVSFRDSTQVTVDLNGNPDEAGFVQVILGRGSDAARARELLTQDTEAWAAFRPEILGTVVVEHGGGGYTMAAYFTTEAAAREGERRQPPPELAARMEELTKLNIEEPEYFDLTDPWIR